MIPDWFPQEHIKKNQRNLKNGWQMNKLKSGIKEIKLKTPIKKLANLLRNLKKKKKLQWIFWTTEMETPQGAKEYLDKILKYR